MVWSRSSITKRRGIISPGNARALQKRLPAVALNAKGRAKPNRERSRPLARPGRRHRKPRGGRGRLPAWPRRAAARSRASPRGPPDPEGPAAAPLRRVRRSPAGRARARPPASPDRGADRATRDACLHSIESKLRAQKAGSTQLGDGNAVAALVLLGGARA